MKTFVFLAGLMVIVPRVDPRGEWQGLTVLVLDVEAAAKATGAPHHHHVTTVTNFGGTFHEPLTGAWTLRSNAAGPMEIVGDDRYLVLERIYGSDSSLPPMQADCYGTKFATHCRNDKKYDNALVRAVLHFKGGWRIRPVEITHDREPRALVYDDSLWGFLPFPANNLAPRSSPPDVQLSGGLILEPLDDHDDDDANDVTFETPNQPLGTLASLRPQVCHLFAGHAGRCAVVRFLNVMHAMSFGQEDKQVIDFTQDLVYDLFRDEKDQTEPPVRYLTVLRKDARPEVMDILYPGGGGTPFPRPCPPPTFAPPIEVSP